MNFIHSLGLKKFFLYLLIASISIDALMGIAAIISGAPGEFEIRILLTALTIAATSVCGLACGAFLESKQSRNTSLLVVPIAGIAASVLAALFLLRFIWLPPSFNFNDGKIIELTICACIFAVALAHLSLLSLAKLADKFKWALVVAYVTILFLAAFLCFLVFIQPEGSGIGTFQLVGVAVIIDAAVSIMIPVFHLLSRADFQAAEKLTTDEIDLEINKLKRQISDLENRRQVILDSEQVKK